MAKKSARDRAAERQNKKGGKGKGKVELTKEQRDDQAVNKLLGPDAGGAKALSERFMPEGSLGRVDEGRSGETQDVLNRLRGSMEAYGPGGGARRSADTQESIDRQRKGLDRSGETQDILDRTKGQLGRNKETQDLLDSLKGKTGRSAEVAEALAMEKGKLGRSAEDQKALDKLDAATIRDAETQGLLDTAKSRSGRTAETADFLKRSQAGLEGYSAAENQGQREQMNRGANTAYQQAVSRLNKQAGNLGIRGGAVAALQGKAEKGLARQQALTEQDIFVKNVDEKQKRLAGYGSAVQDIDDAEHRRFESYGKLAMDVSKEERSRRLDYAGAARDVQDFEADKLQSYGKNLRTSETDEQGRLRDYTDATRDVQESEYKRNDNYNALVRNAGRDDRDRLNDYRDTVRDAEDSEYERTMDTTDAYSSSLRGARRDELDRRLVNSDRIIAERGGQAGTFFSALERGAEMKGGEEDRRLNRKMFGLAKSMYGRGGSGKGDGRSRGSGGAPAQQPNMQSYFDERRNMVNQRYK